MFRHGFAWLRPHVRAGRSGAPATECGLEPTTVTDPDGKQGKQGKERNGGCQARSDPHPVEDEVHVLEVVVKREAGIKFLRTDKPHDLLVA